MILALLLLAASQPVTAADAGRALAEDARRLGQWTALRKWAAADSLMFVPEPTGARDWLKKRNEPARAVQRWPTASWVSCDGTLAAVTGGSRWTNGDVGFFTTVWQRQPDGQWHWLIDGGDSLKQARLRARTTPVVRAACATPKPAYTPPTGTHAGAGWSADHSLIWEWAFNATGHTRVFTVSIWKGDKYVEVLEDLIDVP